MSQGRVCLPTQINPKWSTWGKISAEIPGTVQTLIHPCATKGLLSAFCLSVSSFESWNPRIVWVGRDPKTHPVPTPWVKTPLFSVQVKLLPNHSGGFWNKVTISTQNFALIQEICLKFHLPWDPYFCTCVENFQLNALGISCPWNGTLPCRCIYHLLYYCIYYLLLYFSLTICFSYAFWLAGSLEYLCWSTFHGSLGMSVFLLMKNINYFLKGNTAVCFI